jgi:hypothetical protein
VDALIALLGAVVGAGAAFGGQALLEQRRGRGELRAALRLIETELSDNVARMTAWQDLGRFPRPRVATWKATRATIAKSAPAALRKALFDAYGLLELLTDSELLHEAIVISNDDLASLEDWATQGASKALRVLRQHPDITPPPQVTLEDILGAQLPRAVSEAEPPREQLAIPDI